MARNKRKTKFPDGSEMGLEYPQRQVERKDQNGQPHGAAAVAFAANEVPARQEDRGGNRQQKQ